VVGNIKLQTGNNEDIDDFWKMTFALHGLLMLLLG
jgi:hypothetical protein